MKENIDPKMHTTEHILNQTMVRMFNTGRCFSAHIEKKKSKCDYHFSRNLTAEEVQAVENKINEIIKENLPITEIFLPLAEVREKFKAEHLPDDLDMVRVIKIGDYDAVPCYGPHVSSTQEIGQCKIISTDYADNVLRIRYKLR